MSLSVIIITKNEEASIRACLESVSWADEIVVVDAGSEDKTVQICREYTRNVFIADWQGFGRQKNRALEKATCSWVLSLDADERITEELASEIKGVLSKPVEKTAFKIPRSSRYCSRYMKHGGWWPDYVTRLFLRGGAHFSDDLVHERLVVNGSEGILENPIIHESFENLEEVIDKINSYSTAGARMKNMEGARSSLLVAVSHGLWSFFHTYIVRAGFLDGREGFMLAVSNAEGTYYRYVKLMLLNESQKCD